MKSIQESLASCLQNMKTEQKSEVDICVESEFCFPESFPGFVGHFPDKPVLPAIVQLSVVRHIAESALQKLLKADNFSKTKFRSMVVPDQKILIRLDLGTVDNNFHGKFRISTTDNELITTGNCIFSETL